MLRAFRRQGYQFLPPRSSDECPHLDPMRNRDGDGMYCPDCGAHLDEENKNADHDIPSR